MMKTILFILLAATPVHSESLLNYFGNEINVPVGFSTYNGRGQYTTGGAVSLAGYLLTGYQLTSNIKYRNIQVLSWITCNTWRGPVRVWIANHQDRGAMSFSKIFSEPVVTDGECWVQMEMLNESGALRIKNYEWQVIMESRTQ